MSPDTDVFILATQKLPLLGDVSIYGSWHRYEKVLGEFATYI